MSPLLQSVPFFSNANHQFIADIVSKLRFEVYLTGEYICRTGYKGDKMYFIQRGIVDVLTKDGILATSLGDGSHFGGKPDSAKNLVLSPGVRERSGTRLLFTIPPTQLPHLPNYPPTQLPHLPNYPTHPTTPPTQLPHLPNYPPTQLPHPPNYPTYPTTPHTQLPHTLNYPTHPTTPLTQLPHTLNYPTHPTSPLIQLHHPPTNSGCLCPQVFY